MNLLLTTKISAGMRIQRYLLLLKHTKVQQIYFANCVEEVWVQPQRDYKSDYNENHLKLKIISQQISNDYKWFSANLLTSVILSFCSKENLLLKFLKMSY